MSKFRAIWKILINEHYAVVTPRTVIFCYPKELTKDTKMIREILVMCQNQEAERVAEAQLKPEENK